MTHSKMDCPNRFFLLPLLALALGASACSEEPTACISPEPAHFVDADLTHSIAGGGCRDRAIQPFAVGAGATFRVLSVDEALTFDVTDSSVMEVASLPDGAARVTFLAAGSATLTARSSVDGSLVARVDLESMAADRVEWEFGAEMMGAFPVTMDTPNVAVGGRAPILARLYAGEQQLRGSGVLQVMSGPATIRHGGLTDSDWLVVAPEAEGMVDIEVSLGPGALVTYPVNAVPGEDIARLELKSEEASFGGVDEMNEARPDVPSVYAQGFLADGSPVLGAPVEWTLEGDVLGARGDIFQYELDTTRSGTLQARIGDVSVSVPVRAAAAEGARVTQGDELACSASGNPNAGLGTLALAMLALLLVSRRRARRA